MIATPPVALAPVLVALAVPMPLVTTLCLDSGMSGGLFTPVLSTGAAFGGVLGGVVVAVARGAE